MVGSSTEVPVSHPSPSFSPYFYFFLLFYLETLIYFVLPFPHTHFLLSLSCFSPTPPPLQPGCL